MSLFYFTKFKRYLSGNLKGIYIVCHILYVPLNIVCDMFIHADSEGDTQNPALLQYVFTFDEHPVEIAPHGNSKKSEAYVRTMPSVMDKLKCASTSNTAKRALTFVSNESGGITKASSAAALPRGRQQVNDIRRGSLKSTCDPIFSLMMMCKEGEGGKSSNVFVRIVTGAPYPMMLLHLTGLLTILSDFVHQSQDSALWVSIQPLT